MLTKTRTALLDAASAPPLGRLRVRGTRLPAALRALAPDYVPAPSTEQTVRQKLGLDP